MFINDHMLVQNILLAESFNQWDRIEFCNFVFTISIFFGYSYLHLYIRYLKVDNQLDEERIPAFSTYDILFTSRRRQFQCVCFRQ